jgi:hypothetical protein
MEHADRRKAMSVQQASAVLNTGIAEPAHPTVAQGANLLGLGLDLLVAEVVSLVYTLLKHHKLQLQTQQCISYLMVQGSMPAKAGSELQLVSSMLIRPVRKSMGPHREG